MNEPEQPRKGWGCLHWGAVVIVLGLAVLLLLPNLNMISRMADQTKTANNCRQIIMCLKVWANDNNGVFPDAAMPLPMSSNQAFRKLFQEEIVQDERIFGASYSPFKPDNDIGVAPSFSRALEPGENHWAMVAGLKADSNGTLPLIFENPLSAEWPPQWRLDRQKEPVRGRTWKRGKLVIGRMDNSVNVEPLVKKDGVMILPDSLRKLFGKQSELPLRILDIEEKK